MNAPQRHFVEYHKVDQVRENLKDDGLVLIEGLRSTDDLAWLAHEMGVPIQHRDSNLPGGIITLRPKDGIERETFKGYTRKEQYLHTDGTMVQAPADIVVLTCERKAPQGGESIFLDGKVLYEKLSAASPELLAAMLKPDAATFGEPSDKLLKKPIFMHTDDGLRSIAFRYDALVAFSPAIKDKLGRLLQVMDEHLFEVPLTPGQGYVLNNHRFIHGRRSFTGDRIIHRVQIHAQPELHLPKGF